MPVMNYCEKASTVEPPLTGTSLQRPVVFFFAGQSIHSLLSCFNLSTPATFFCPQGDSYREVQLNANYLPLPSILSVLRLRKLLIFLPSTLRFQ